jgi:hypothetical protein
MMTGRQGLVVDWDAVLDVGEEVVAVGDAVGVKVGDAAEAVVEDKVAAGGAAGV